MNVKIVYLVALILAGDLASAQPALRLKAWKRSASGREAVAHAAVKTRTPGRSHLIVQFGENPNVDQLSELAQRGAAVLSYIPDRALSISAEDGTSMDGLGITWVGRLEPGEKISPDIRAGLASGAAIPLLVEFYPDIDSSQARAVVIGEGAILHENPDLTPNHLLISADARQAWKIASWDEVAYIFPASDELIAGSPVQSCAGAFTSLGLVGQSVALMGDGWDGPGRGGADLKYWLVQGTDKVPAGAAESEIVRAFAEWTKYVKVSFSPAPSAVAGQTIAILFARGAHGDSYPFDGPSGVIAHTFYPFPVNPEPIAGDMHFDADENWKIGADLDVFSSALHETGHALGLGHSDNPNAVMYPYYHRRTALNQEDIDAVLQLYAAQDGVPSEPKPAPAPAPNPLTLTAQVPSTPTMSTAISVSGTTSGGVGNVQVSWATNYATSGMALGSSNWTIAAIPLSVGDNVITITATDSQQTRASRTLKVTRLANTPQPGTPDATAPSLTITSPGATTVSTSLSTIVLSGTTKDNVGVTRVTWTSSTGGSGTASGGATSWKTPVIPLYVGTTTIVIRAFDAAGNASWRSIMVTRR